jgi:hypothetical protein
MQLHDGRSQSDTSTTTNIKRAAQHLDNSNHPPSVSFGPPIKAAPPHHNPGQDNCSTLAWHLFSHVKRMRFIMKAQVAEWCQSHINEYQDLAIEPNHPDEHGEYKIMPPLCG